MPRGRVSRKETEKPSEKELLKAKIGRPSPTMEAVPVPDEAPTIIGVTESALKDLQHLQSAVSKQIAAGSVTAATQREAAALARAVIALGAEMRQQKKWYEAQQANLTEAEEDEIVLEFIRGLSPARKRKYREAVAEEEGTTILS